MENKKKIINLQKEKLKNQKKEKYFAFFFLLVNQQNQTYLQFIYLLKLVKGIILIMHSKIVQLGSKKFTRMKNETFIKESKKTIHFFDDRIRRG